MPLIYQIVRKSDESCVYIGSTKDSLRDRIMNHLRCSKIKDYRLYQIIGQEGWDAFEFVVLEEVEDTSDLLWLEKQYIVNLNPMANTYLPVRTMEEKTQQTVKATKTWREKNPLFTCNCGSKVRRHVKARHEKSKKHIKYLNDKQKPNGNSC